jgi:hypothetical protein
LLPALLEAASVALCGTAVAAQAVSPILATTVVSANVMSRVIPMRLNISGDVIKYRLYFRLFLNVSPGGRVDWPILIRMWREPARGRIVGRYSNPSHPRADNCGGTP